MHTRTHAVQTTCGDGFSMRACATETCTRMHTRALEPCECSGVGGCPYNLYCFVLRLQGHVHARCRRRSRRRRGRRRMAAVVATAVVFAVDGCVCACMPLSESACMQ